MTWDSTTLGEVAELLSGGTPSKNWADYWDGDIPWVSAKDLKRNYIYDSELHVTEAGAANGTKTVPENTVLFVVRGMSLANEFRISLSKIPVSFNQDIKALRAREGVDPSFLFYALFVQRDIIRQRTGEASHGTKKLETDVAKAIKLKMPRTLAEQRKIASVAEAYDLLIENNRRRIELLEQSPRLLFKEWFVRLRYPGHGHDKIINGVPEGWGREAFPSIIEINPRERSIKGAELWYVPMSSLSEVGMTLDSDGFERRTSHTSVKFRNGDTLFARITPCLENGKTGYVDFLENGEVACGSTEFIVLRGKAVSSEVTYCLAREEYVRGRAIKSMIGSSGRQRVQESCFDDLRANIPPSALMENFQEAATGCFEQIKNLRRQNQKLSRARDLLLPRLMDGSLSV